MALASAGFDIKPAPDKAKASISLDDENFGKGSTGVDIRKADGHVDGNAVGLPGFDDRHAAGREQFYGARRMRKACQNERIRLSLQKGRDQMLLPLDRMVAVAEQRRKTLLLQHRHDAADLFGIDRRRECRDDGGDRSASAGSKMARRTIGDVVELVDGGLHQLPRYHGNQFRPSKDP